MHPALIDELEKLGTISPDQAEAAYDRLQQLEQNKPTAGQALRYGAIGAVAGPLSVAAADTVRGQAPFKPVEHNGRPIRMGRARSAAGTAVGGAIMGGVAPLLRYHLDRAGEMRTLHQFMKEYEEGQSPNKAKHAMRVKLEGDALIEVDEHGRSLGKGPLKEKDADAFDLNYSPGDFAVNPYSGGLGAGPIQLASLLNGEDPSLEAPVKRKKASALDAFLEAAKEAASMMPAISNSPKMKLTSGQKIGQPKMTAPSGPSIADVSKPRGFGMPAPGALKGSI